MEKLSEEYVFRNYNSFVNPLSKLVCRLYL